MEGNILKAEQIQKILSAFEKGRAAQSGSVPTEEECESILSWFSEVTKGAMLMQWVLDGELVLNMKDDIIAFINISQDETLSPTIMKQLESLDFDNDNLV